MINRVLLLCLFLSAASVAFAADSLQLIRSVPVSGHMMQVDELGNCYLVRNDNTLIRYNEKGDSTTNFRSIANGDIGYLDVTNPLRILIYYPDFAKLVLLDRMLSLKNELNLRRLNLLNTNVIATSADANLWVFDQFNATLNKLDMQLNYMIRGNDLRQQLAELPIPVFMTERERRVYMVDSVQGVLVFDQYGSYINTLSITGIRRLQVIGTQLIYRKGNYLYAYDMQQLTETAVQLPPDAAGSPLLDAALCRNVLYLLYNNKLVLYHLP